MNEKEFDIQVRNLLQSAEEPVSPKVWEGVAAGLDKRRRIVPGERVCLTRCAIVRGVGGGVYDRWFELSGIRARMDRPLVGYTSWYKHYGDIDEKCLAEDLAGAATG